MDNIALYIGIAACVFGCIIWFTARRKRATQQENWQNQLDTAYLLLTIGIGFLLFTMFKWSTTAVFLCIATIAVIAKIWQIYLRKKQTQDWQDENYLRCFLADFATLAVGIFIVRAFILEPFIVPSSSMRPNLIVSDLLLTSKFSYGIRMPLTNQVVISTGQVQRGDVVVFQYPLDKNQNFVKRFIGISGDHIVYRNKILTINGKQANDIQQGDYIYPDDKQADIQHQVQQFQSNQAERTFNILKDSNQPVSFSPDALIHYANEAHSKGVQSRLAEFCRFDADGNGFECTVPQGKYFAMGDNRDNSADSRYWGFVDDDLIVGKVMMVAVNLRDWTRFGIRF